VFCFKSQSSPPGGVTVPLLFICEILPEGASAIVIVDESDASYHKVRLPETPGVVVISVGCHNGIGTPEGVTVGVRVLVCVDVLVGVGVTGQGDVF